MAEYELKAQIREEHRRAELQRLEEGQDGCGCPECQELYKTLDLTQYGSRVIRSGGVVIIKGLRESPDYWADDGATFVHYSKGYRVGKNLQTYCIGKYPPDKPTEPPIPPTEVSKAAVTALPTSKVSTSADVTDKYALKCIVCGKDFSANRSDAEYCSSSCRVAAHRAKQGAML